MLRTLHAVKPCIKCFTAIIEELYNKSNTIINNINCQNSVISMELLRKFSVKIVNRHKKYIITYYNYEKAIFDRFPGDFVEVIKNSYGLFMGRLARG